jgi:NADP-dependent aldehyde dehydrogenase
VKRNEATASTLTGSSIIAGIDLFGDAGVLNGTNPATGKALAPAYGLVGADQVARAAEAAAEAFPSYRATSDQDRAAFLESIADNLETIREHLVNRVEAETAIPSARADGELTRTTDQLRLFATILRDGSWHGARIARGDPNRVPSKPDLRMHWISVGPVAVFGASNFPLAFSVAGGDTASALAAGSPVVVKAHPGHPGTSELVGNAIRSAVSEHGIHPGVFSLLFVRDNATAATLVAHPAISAVAFTGSRTAGLALSAAAAARVRPIPVFAEMSSVNPVFLFQSALGQFAERLGVEWVASLSLGVGQLCTSPGIVVMKSGPEAERFLAAAGAAVGGTPNATMLSKGIATRYWDGIATRAAIPGVSLPARGGPSDARNAAQVTLFVTGAQTFLAETSLRDEIFGPSGIVVLVDDEKEFSQVLRALEGQLTVSIHSTDAEPLAVELVACAETVAGRIIFNGWPTGVEVGYATVHGGPYPATTNGQTTSVGALAINRFLRPVSYQNAPGDFLASELKDRNPMGIWREIDGVGSRS